MEKNHTFNGLSTKVAVFGRNAKQRNAKGRETCVRSFQSDGTVECSARWE